MICDWTPLSSCQKVRLPPRNPPSARGNLDKLNVLFVFEGVSPPDWSDETAATLLSSVLLTTFFPLSVGLGENSEFP